MKELFESYKKEWNTSSGVLKLKINHSTNEVCFLLQTDEKLHNIPLSDVRGIPKAVLEDKQKLAAFIKDSYVKVSVCDDGMHKLYINQKLLGGGNIETNRETLWPNAIVPYHINTKTFPTNSTQYQAITNAIDSWKRANTGFQFVQKTTEVDYVDFDWDASESPNCLGDVEHCSTCESPIGRQGGRQLINCDLRTGNFNTNSIMHEIGHAIGLYHEQQRNDRDTYVKVKGDTLNNDANYGKTAADNTYGEYDFKSIMHYHFFDNGNMQIRNTLPKYQHQQIVALSNNQSTPVKGLDKDKLNTIENPSLHEEIWNGVFKVGLESNLSQGDIAAASELARQGKDFKIFKNIAQQYDKRGDILSAIKYYAITQRVHLTHENSSDGETNDELFRYYHIAVDIQQNNMGKAREILEKLVSECYDPAPDTSIGVCAGDKLREINSFPHGL